MDVTRKEHVLFGGQLGLLLVAISGAIILSSPDDWRPVSLFLALLVTGACGAGFQHEGKGFNVTTAFLAIVLAMVLLGPSPAAVIGVVAMLVNGWRRHARWRLIFTNVSTFAAFPVLGGWMFETFGGERLQASEGSIYVLLILGVFMLTNLLNFLLIAVDVAVMDHQPVLRSLRYVYLPTVPTELAVGLLTAAVAFVYQRHDVSALVMLVVVAFIFQYLLGTVLSSLQRKEELETPDAAARLAPGGSSQHRAADALNARQDDRSALGRRRPLCAGSRPRDGPEQARAGDHPHRRPAP